MVNTEVIAKEVVVCLATIFIRMFGIQLFLQLLVKNSDVKESLIQTKVMPINMQLPLRDGIITGKLSHKYHEPVPKNRK